jgi:hypothetical protein
LWITAATVPPTSSRPVDQSELFSLSEEADVTLEALAPAGLLRHQDPASRTDPTDARQ